jgi:hypothetical protein
MDGGREGERERETWIPGNGKRQQAGCLDVRDFDLQILMQTPCILHAQARTLATQNDGRAVCSLCDEPYACINVRRMLSFKKSRSSNSSGRAQCMPCRSKKL